MNEFPGEDTDPESLDTLLRENPGLTKPEHTKEYQARFNGEHVAQLADPFSPTFMPAKLANAFPTKWSADEVVIAYMEAGQSFEDNPLTPETAKSYHKKFSVAEVITMHRLGIKPAEANRRVGKMKAQIKGEAEEVRQDIASIIDYGVFVQFAEP